jgi:hypothetical protein
MLEMRMPDHPEIPTCGKHGRSGSVTNLKSHNRPSITSQLDFRFVRESAAWKSAYPVR